MRFFILSIVCAVVSAASPLDFYVSPSGDDSNPGTSDAPFATPERGLAAVATAAGSAGGCGGDATVHLSSGEWFLSRPLVLDTAHTCGGGFATKIVGAGAVAAGGSGTTLLSAGVPLTSWTPVAAGVWSTDLPPSVSFVRAIFAHGAAPPTARRFLARTPIMIADAVGQWGVRWAEGDAPVLGPKAYAEAELMIYHQWTNSQNKIASINATCVLPVGTAGDQFFAAGGKRWALQNVADVPSLDAGQFYVSDGRITYRGLPGEDPTIPGGLVLIAERLPEALIVNGTAASPVTGVLVANLTIAHTAADLEAQCLHDGCGGQSNSEASSAAVHATYATAAAFDGVEVTGSGGYAVWLDVGCTRCALTRSLLHDLGQGGARVGNGDNTGSPSSSPAHSCEVSDCVIADGGHVVPAGTGVLAQEAANTSIVHNHVHHLRYTGISTGWSWGYMSSADAGQLVAFNDIHDIFMTELTDGGCIYNLGRSPGTRIQNNWCHDSDSFAYGGWGLYLDEGSSNVTMQDNIVFATKDAAFHQHYGTDNLITNNIWAFASSLPCNHATDDCDASALRSSQHPVSSHDAGVNSSFTFKTNVVLLGGNTATAPWVVNNTKIVRTNGPTLGVENFTYINNLYWHNTYANPAEVLRFGATGDDMTFTAWQKAGKDTSGQIADPLFKDALGLDFDFLPGSPALAMGFKPINMSTVGVRDGPFKGM